MEERGYSESPRHSYLNDRHEDGTGDGEGVRPLVVLQSTTDRAAEESRHPFLPVLGLEVQDEGPAALVSEAALCSNAAPCWSSRGRGSEGKRTLP